MSKIERVKKSLLAHSKSKYAELSLPACCSYISWLARFKKIDEKTISFLSDFAVLCLGGMSAEEEVDFLEKYKKELERI